MVKPPKTMEPEAVNLKKAGRDAQKAFQEDSFHNYMARKIDMQRQQFGLLLPPAPLEIHKSPGEPKAKKIRFASETDDAQPSSKKRTRSKKFGVSAVLKRLKRRHGKSRKPEKRCDVALQGEGEASHGEHQQPRAAPQHSTSRLDTNSEEKDPVKSPSVTSPGRSILKHRPDLFFTGVVVLVNGFTNPDTETLQRLLHKHGGDLEKYETSRVTHIIAERLSTAKANMYKRQRRPRLVCKPGWIVESVQAGKLLLASDYLINEVKDDSAIGIKSVASFFPKGGHVDVVSSQFVDMDCGDAGVDPNDLVACADPEDADEPDLSQECVDDVVVGVEHALPNEDTTVSKVTTHVTENHSSYRKEVTTKSPAIDRYVNGRVRTVGTDPNFLDSFFAASRLSFIGSYKQRARQSPTKNALKGNSSSKRFVFHVDMDCFFASVVLRKYPEYRDKPVAISHHGEKKGESASNAVRDVPKDSSSECATCNYEARKYGVEKGMYLGRAKALCPDLIVLPYDFEGYEEVSEAVSDILDRHASENAGYVEHVSCDEAYVEFHLHDKDGKSPAFLAAELAETIRNEIFDVTQCTATVGVATNKLLAKLATDHVKPNKSYVVDNFTDLLKSMQLRELHGIGYHMERKLEEEELITVQDVWDLGNRGEAELCRILGTRLGKKIYGFCRGEDDRLVQPAERKTIGAEVSGGFEQTVLWLVFPRFARITEIR